MNTIKMIFSYFSDKWCTEAAKIQQLHLIYWFNCLSESKNSLLRTSDQEWFYKIRHEK